MESRKILKKLVCVPTSDYQPDNKACFKLYSKEPENSILKVNKISNYLNKKITENGETKIGIKF
ncbi:hypothetical protein D1816_11405 [Aquimarina sp. AD10]|nr:hypothetical protein D1816_11405 [Aquimarina sp. AD10]RKM95571.1 hypothetical protein D7033_16880 [Aquimarina sp. AD10]